jgi:hypothetical protein
MGDQPHDSTLGGDLAGRGVDGHAGGGS